MMRINSRRDFRESSYIRKKRFREEEDNYITKTFFCGPGTVRTYCMDEEEGDYDEKETEFDRSTARKIDRYILDGDDWCEDLAEYYRGEGVKSIVYSHMTSFEGEYYMAWNITYDPKKVDLDDLEDYMEGQMADGWGESFEQHPFEVEGDDFWHKEERSYSPWTPEDFRLIMSSRN